jgi:dihydroflavonol-4-reductase
MNQSNPNPASKSPAVRRARSAVRGPVLVTGATGFVGSHVAQALAAEGADLRLLIRASSNLANIAGLKAETVIGDLTDAVSLRKAMQGCEFVFHVAADYRLWVRNPDQMYRANVEGTREIIRAAAETGVRRVIYTSSVATMGFTTSATIVDESTPVSLKNMIGHYKRSKFMAEQIALEAGEKGVDIVVVNPTTPVGEQDIKPTPTGRIIVDFLDRKFPAYVDTGLNLADVREVARGHLLAMEHAVPGRRYILGGENLTLKAILDRLAALTGLPSPRVRVPHAVALGFAAFDQLVTGVILRKEPRATIEAVRMGRKKMFASSARAEAELGYRVLPVDDALRRAVQWFQAHRNVEIDARMATARA